MGAMPLTVIKTLPLTAGVFTRSYRVEVTGGGKYWQWRERGSRENGQKRKTRYGGKVETLSKERLAQYEQNKQRRSGNTSGGGGNSNVGSKLLSGGGNNDYTRYVRTDKR